MTGAHREIALTRGLVALVDEADYEWLSRWKWHASSKGYAKRRIQLPSGEWRHLSMHRAILGVTDPKVQVDHINGDGLDNRRANLRLASNAENSWNQRPQSNTSGFKGVSRHKRKWRARIMVDGRSYSIGLFPTAEEAAAAYDKVAVLFYGQFARTNSPGHLKSNEDAPWLVSGYESAARTGLPEGQDTREQVNSPQISGAVETVTYMTLDPQGWLDGVR